MEQVPDNHVLSCPVCGRDSSESPTSAPSGGFFLPEDFQTCTCDSCRRRITRFTASGLVQNGILSLVSTGMTGLFLFHAGRLLLELFSGNASLSRAIVTCVLLLMATFFGYYLLRTSFVFRDTLYHGTAPARKRSSRHREALRALACSGIFILLALGAVMLIETLSFRVAGFVEMFAAGSLLLAMLIARRTGVRIRVFAAVMLGWALLFAAALMIVSDDRNALTRHVKNMAWHFEGPAGNSPGQILAEDDHYGPVLSISVSPDRPVMASGSADGSVLLRNVKDGEIYFRLDCGDAVKDVRFSPDGSYLATLTQGGSIQIWDVLKGEPVATLPKPHYRSMSFTHSGSGLIAAGDTSISMWPAPYQLKLWTFPVANKIFALALNRKDTRLFASFDRESLRGLAAWNLENGEPAGKPELMGARVRAFSLLGDGLLAMNSGTDSSPVMLWSVDAGQMLGTLGEADGFVDSITVLPQKRLLCATGQGLPVLWDGTTGHRTVIRGHKGQAHAAAFTPDGTRLITGDDSGTVRIWNLQKLLRR